MRLDHELKIGFLVNKTVIWTPTIFRIWRPHSVDAWLRVSGEESVFVHNHKNIMYIYWFWSKTALTKWELLDLSSNEVNKYIAYFLHACAFGSPELQFIFQVTCNPLGTVVVLLVFKIKGCWLACSPPSIRIFIPIICSWQVTLWLVWPENWSNIFRQSALILIK